MDEYKLTQNLNKDIGDVKKSEDILERFGVSTEDKPKLYQCKPFEASSESFVNTTTKPDITNTTICDICQIPDITGTCRQCGIFQYGDLFDIRRRQVNGEQKTGQAGFNADAKR